MYDPSFQYDKRLAAETGLYDGIDFQPVPKGTETELKFLSGSNSFSDFEAIKKAIDAKKNRLLDPRSFSAKEHALVTLNIDTVNRDIHQMGYSLRVRFALDVDNPNAKISKIDISLKTLLSDSNVIYLHNNRGEWEAELDSLVPDLYQIYLQNKDNTKKRDKSVPKFIQQQRFRPEELFTESVGCCWRREFLSTHHLPDIRQSALYHHTEDCNFFTTPVCDIWDGVFDREAEAELQGFMGVDSHLIREDDFNKYCLQSLDLTKALIENASPSLTWNNASKAVRAATAVRRLYKYMVGPGLTGDFNPSVFEAARYSLSQKIMPQDVPYQNLASPMMGLRHQIETNMESTHTKDRKFICSWK